VGQPREVITALSRNGSHRPNFHLEPAGNPGQNFITCRMTKAVIQELEVVQVYK
jgi:hypothetical protein